MSEAFSNFVDRASKKVKARTPDSCRFSPYYKAQWYDIKALAWRDVSERFTTPAEAKRRFNKKKKWRVMEVSMNGRRVYEG